jgi:hypothetical protein
MTIFAMMTQSPEGMGENGKITPVMQALNTSILALPRQEGREFLIFCDFIM